MGKNMESALNTANQKAWRRSRPQSQQPRPDPEMAKVQMQGQVEQAKMQGQQQIEQMKAQNEAQMQQVELQASVQAEQAKAQAQAAVQQHLNELENQRRMAELQGEEEIWRSSRPIWMPKRSKPRLRLPSVLLRSKTNAKSSRPASSRKPLSPWPISMPAQRQI